MKLILRQQTELGPRTVVMQGLDPKDASMLADHTIVAGGDAIVMEDGERYSFAAHFLKRKGAAKRAAKKAQSIAMKAPNVVAIIKAKRRSTAK